MSGVPAKAAAGSSSGASSDGDDTAVALGTSSDVGVGVVGESVDVAPEPDSSSSSPPRPPKRTRTRSTRATSSNSTEPLSSEVQQKKTRSKTTRKKTTQGTKKKKRAASDAEVTTDDATEEELDKASARLAFALQREETAEYDRTRQPEDVESNDEPLTYQQLDDSIAAIQKGILEDLKIELQGIGREQYYDDVAQRVRVWDYVDRTMLKNARSSRNQQNAAVVAAAYKQKEEIRRLIDTISQNTEQDDSDEFDIPVKELRSTSPKEAEVSNGLGDFPSDVDMQDVAPLEAVDETPLNKRSEAFYGKPTWERISRALRLHGYPVGSELIMQARSKGVTKRRAIARPRRGHTVTPYNAYIVRAADGEYKGLRLKTFVTGKEKPDERNLRNVVGYNPVADISIPVDEMPPLHMRATTARELRCVMFLYDPDTGDVVKLTSRASVQTRVKTTWASPVGFSTSTVFVPIVGDVCVVVNSTDHGVCCDVANRMFSATFDGGNGLMRDYNPFSRDGFSVIPASSDETPYGVSMDYVDNEVVSKMTPLYDVPQEEVPQDGPIDDAQAVDGMDISEDAQDFASDDARIGL